MPVVYRRCTAKAKEAVMATWVWIVIAIGALLVLGLVGFGMMRGREKAQRREKAQELRQEAQTRLEQAEERERVAREQQQQARDTRKVAAEVGARADQLDPDREMPDDDE
ncbi:MAG: hypothetical protein E6G12_11250 [Actinobacteria bacterium]|nr:MAG: hypothetical protein E6G12_11250 [Actinomycetota bacterium]